MSKATQNVPTIPAPVEVPTVTEAAPAPVVPEVAAQHTSEQAAAVSSEPKDDDLLAKLDAQNKLLNDIYKDIIREGFGALGRIRNVLEAYLEAK